MKKVILKNKDALGRTLPLTFESDLVVGDKIILPKHSIQNRIQLCVKGIHTYIRKYSTKTFRKDKLFFKIEDYVCCTSHGRETP